MSYDIQIHVQIYDIRREGLTLSDPYFIATCGDQVYKSKARNNVSAIVESFRFMYHFERPQNIRIEVYDLNTITHDKIIDVYNIRFGSIISRSMDETGRRSKIIVQTRSTDTSHYLTYIRTEDQRSITIDNNPTIKGRFAMTLTKYKDVPIKINGERVRYDQTVLRRNRFLSCFGYQDCYYSVTQFHMIAFPLLLSKIRFRLSITYDFTASNNTHQLHAGPNNDYIKVTEKIADLFQYYPVIEEVPVHSFGMGGSSVTMVPGTYHTKTHITTLKDEYILHRTNAETLGFNGPTSILGMLDLFREDIQTSSSDIYHVNVIITDGEFIDFEKMKAELSHMSSYPVSFLFVGIGPGPFDEMRAVDGDDFQVPTIYKRDNVDFVASPDNVYSLLSELPAHIQTYYSIYRYDDYNDTLLLPFAPYDDDNL